MKKKILCLLLSVLMLVGTLSVLTACGGSDDGDDGNPCEKKCQKIDENGDWVCDNELCKKPIKHDHKDENGDEKCDLCKKDMDELAKEEEDFPTVSWIDKDPIDLFFQMTKNTDNQSNPSGCERYLAGDRKSVV